MIKDALNRYLARLNIHSYEEMSDEERTTFHQWEQTLAGRELTSAEVRAVLASDREEAVRLLTTKKLGEREDTFLKVKVDFINRFFEILDSPKAEKAAIEHLISN